MGKRRFLGKQTNEELKAISKKQVNDLSQVYGVGIKTVSKIRAGIGRTDLSYLRKFTDEQLMSLGLSKSQVYNMRNVKISKKANLDLEKMSNEELKGMSGNISSILKRRSKKKYHELKIDANPYKGTGKCWIQRIEDGKRTSFVDPYDVEKDRYKLEKTFRLQPGMYLVNTSGSKSYDKRYKIKINPDYTIEEK